MFVPATFTSPGVLFNGTVRNPQSDDPENHLERRLRYANAQCTARAVAYDQLTQAHNQLKSHVFTLHKKNQGQKTELKKLNKENQRLKRQVKEKDTELQNIVRIANICITTMIASYLFFTGSLVSCCIGISVVIIGAMIEYRFQS